MSNQDNWCPEHEDRYHEGCQPCTDRIEAFATRIGLGPHREWYRFGWKSPMILYKRLSSKYRPIFRLKMAYQRATRGYGDNDIWNLNHTLAKLTVVGCRTLRENAYGYPSEFSEDVGNGQGWEAWEKILIQIEEGFQAWLDCDGWFYKKEEEEAKYKKAMELYAEWFGGLWD